MEQLLAVWNFVGEHFWTITAITFAAIYRKAIYKDFIFTPLAGGNGKVQMDEAAKGVIIAVLLWCVARDGYRNHEWAYFSGTFYATLLAGLFAIASIKPITAILNAAKDDKPNTDKSTSDNNSAGSGDRNSPPVD
jgi:hypothetical protein